MPTHCELIAYGRSDEEVARFIGADQLVYQDLEAMQQAVRDFNPRLTRFEASCFDGQYVTGDITGDYLAYLERMRALPPEALQDGNAAQESERMPSQLHLHLSNE